MASASLRTPICDLLGIEFPVFLAGMGGVAYFGVVGLIFGPILVSLFLTLLELYRVEFQAELSKPRG